MSKAEKLVVDQLIKDLRERPEDFKCGEHTLDDSKTGIQYWISNGFFSAGIHRPYEMKFGAFEGWRFHEGLKKWKAWNMLTASNA